MVYHINCTYLVYHLCTFMDLCYNKPMSRIEVAIKLIKELTELVSKQQDSIEKLQEQINLLRRMGITIHPPTRHFDE